MTLYVCCRKMAHSPRGGFVSTEPPWKTGEHRAEAQRIWVPSQGSRGSWAKSGTCRTCPETTHGIIIFTRRPHRWWLTWPTIFMNFTLKIATTHCHVWVLKHKFQGAHLDVLQMFCSLPRRVFLWPDWTPAQLEVESAVETSKEKGGGTWCIYPP